jgi:hypothetical protein
MKTKSNINKPDISLRLIFLLPLLLLAFSYKAFSNIIPTGSFTRINVVSSALPVQTAAENLHVFLKKQCPTVNVSIVTDVGTDKKPDAGTIIIGTTAESPVLKQWKETGVLSICASGSGDDSYEIVQLDSCIAVNGANPRAVLYGVFELEDIFAADMGIPAGFTSRAEPSMKIRILHPLSPCGERNGFTKYLKSDFEFIARCGGNVAHLTHDWMREKTLFSFVPSTEFPNAADPKVVEENRKILRQYLDWCKIYGLQAAMWLCEMPCQGGGWVPEPRRKAFLEHFPAECLSESGTKQGKVLCLAHPKVEQEYRRMVRQLVTDFPEISMVLVFTLDANGEFCDPATCPRHKGVSKLTQYNHLLSLMVEEGRKVRPDFQVIFVGWGWKFRGDPEFFSRQEAFSEGTGITLPADGEAWNYDRKLTDLLFRSRAIAKEHQQSFLGYDNFLWSDDTWWNDSKREETNLPEGITSIYDYPLGIAAKLRRWQKLEADGFFDQWGTKAEFIQLNAIALRELIFHSENTNPDNVYNWAQSLSARRFGKDVTPYLLSAWEEIEQAQQLLSDHTYFWHVQRPMWSGPVLKCPLTIEALQSIEISHRQEPPKPYGTHDYVPFRKDTDCAQALAEPLRQAADHFGKALAYLQTASPLVSHTTSAFDHWYQPEPGAPSRFTPQQLIGEQIISVRLQEAVQRRMSRFFEAWALVKTLPDKGTPAYETALLKLKKLQDEDGAPDRLNKANEQREK